MSFTPRHMRRKGNTSKNGSLDPTKSMAFRRAAQKSKRFIHQSASALESPALNNQYREYCAIVDRGSLRGS